MKNYLDGKTVKLVNDSITDGYILDSLMESKGISYEGSETQTTNGITSTTYEFRTIYLEKVRELGFKEKFK